MKSCRLPCLVLALLLGACLGNSAWLSARCGQWREGLDHIDRCARAEDWEEAAGALEDLYGDWLQVQTWLHITMKHEELDEAEALFCRALVLAEEEDSVEFRAHVAELTAALQVLCEMQQTRVENVL